MLRVVLGNRTVRPSSSCVSVIWQPSWVKSKPQAYSQLTSKLNSNTTPSNRHDCKRHWLTNKLGLLPGVKIWPPFLAFNNLARNKALRLNKPTNRLGYKLHN